MGLHLKRSFHTNQPQLDNLIKEYEAMGFQRAHITKAWQQTKQNPSHFHEKLIQVSEEENAKVLSGFDLTSSMNVLKNKLSSKDDEDIKRAIQLSLQSQIIDSPEDIKDLLRTQKNKTVGLKNLGNTCYMNVMLQSLYNIIPFRNLILGLKFSPSENLGQVMIQSLQELFSCLQEGNRQYVSPQAFFESLAKYRPSTMLVKGVQNDYYELWVSFLDAIESGLKEVLKDSPLIQQLTSIFYGRSEENLAYSEADNEIIKSSETQFGVINLDSTQGELYKAFKSCQNLSIDEYLPDGGKPTQAKIEIKLLEPPKVLSFYVNRVTYDQKLKKVVKNNGCFQFHEKIMLDQFYKNPLATTMHNKDIQSRLEKLSQDEAETDDCLRECGEDAQKSDEMFENLIALIRESENGLKRSISVEDFVHLDTEVQHNMLGPAALVQNLEHYKQLFSKRRQVLHKKLEDIRREKKQLLEEKQNLYCLTAVIIHDGSAESGHYFCFVLDKSSKKWIKCNDRTTTVVQFEEVYKTATGKQGSTKNVSGLVYEEQSWLESAQQVSLSSSLQAYVEDQNKTLLQQVDEQIFNGFRGCLMSRGEFLKKKIEANFTAKEELAKILQVFKNVDTFMSTQMRPGVYQLHILKQALKIESEDIKAKLNIPQNYEQYEKAFIQREIRLSKSLKVSEVEQSYFEAMRLYWAVAQLLTPLAANLEKSITLSNYTRILELTIKTYNQLQMLGNGQLDNLSIKIRNLLYALLLKGCFFADYLNLSNQSSKAFTIISTVMQYSEIKPINPVILEQIQQNLKITIERFKSNKMTQASMIQGLQERLSALGKEKSAVQLIQSTLTEQRDQIDVELLCQVMNCLLNVDLKVWYDFVVKINTLNKTIKQDQRLNVEETLYFYVQE